MRWIIATLSAPFMNNHKDVDFDDSARRHGMARFLT